MVDGQWSMVNGPWTVDYGLSTIDHVPPTHSLVLSLRASVPSVVNAAGSAFGGLRHRQGNSKFKI